MIVSFNWLKDYVALESSVEQLTERLMLAGLNHEATVAHGNDFAIDLEVTSNRPDCLGHLGIAREAAVLFGKPLRLPAAAPKEGAEPISKLTSVALDCPALCPRYTARVIRGAKVRPSPAWLANRLATLGIAAINNVVDITNYVLMECGQPLHAFDLAKLAGRRIIVRKATAGEKFLAINHKQYELDPEMCVIADDEHPVALGGVMGGADTEVSQVTTELLIEAAEFSPRSIRRTARQLNLHSDSSYRFERGLDPEGVEWASRRACELILDLCGGELAHGYIDVGRQPTPREPVVLRLSQLKRILGIEIPAAEVRRILSALGNREVRADALSVEVVPPSWRRDLTREIDLIEEVARIHGYEAIPEDVSVPMAPSSRAAIDRVMDRVRETLIASAGIDEALTLSVVEPAISSAFSPWTDAPALKLSMPILRRADELRRSLIPSLLVARQTNEALDNPPVELFETARAYWSQPGELPREEFLLAIASSRDFLAVKGILEVIVRHLNSPSELTVKEFRHELFSLGRACELAIDGERFGFLGELSAEGRKKFELRGPSTVAEVRIAALERIANLIPQAVELSPYPAVERDLNLVVAEAVHWGDVAATIRACCREPISSGWLIATPIATQSCSDRAEEPAR